MTVRGEGNGMAIVSTQKSTSDYYQDFYTNLLLKLWTVVDRFIEIVDLLLMRAFF